METTNNNNEGQVFTFYQEYKWVITDQVTFTANSEEEAKAMALEHMKQGEVSIRKQLSEGDLSRYVEVTDTDVAPFQIVTAADLGM